MSTSSSRTRALGAAAGCLAVALSAMLAPPPAGAAAESGSSRAETVRHWNDVALRTIVAEGLLPAPAVAQVHLGLVSSAVYDALTDARPGRASVRAAVATAAHDVLAATFAGSSAALLADWTATLDSVPDGAAEDRGVALGRAAADRLLASRSPFPTGITLPVDPAPEPGEWRPTPPAFLPMAFPWLGFVEPLLISSPTSIDVGGPDALTSSEYARDLDEVQRIGEVGSTDPAADPANGAFWNAPVGAIFNIGLRDWAERSEMGARATARMFALLNMTTADASIACWRMKYDAPYWRPITAIHHADSDDNPATTADPSWTPVLSTPPLATPPYPEWPSGHACLTASFVRGLTRITGSDAIDLTITNSTLGTSRHYTSAATLVDEAFASRIQLGIHFRDAMEDGYRAGRIASDRGFAAFPR